MPETVETGIALSIAGVPTQVFRDAVNQGHYRVAPRSTGRTRHWTADDIVVAKFFASMRDSGATVSHAASLAYQLHAAMTESPKARPRTLGVYAIPQQDNQVEVVIKAKPPAGARLIFTLPLAEYRRVVAEELREHFLRQKSA